MTDTENNLPKILILNEAFNNNSGGGITLSNLFSGWDPDKIAVVCTSHIIQHINTNTFKNYYQLGYKERRFVFPFNVISRKRYSGPVNINQIKHSSEKTKPAETNNKSSLRHKIVMNYLMPSLEYIGLIKKISKTQLSPELCEWMDNFNPDVIYAQAHDVLDISLILQIHDYLKRPLVFHMMDDWPVMVTSTQFLKSSELRANDRAFKKLVAKSDILMSISDEMAKEYKFRYGKDSIVFHNPIDIDFWKKFQRTNFDMGDSPTLLYAGRLGLGIDTSLELIAKAVELVNVNLGLTMKFVLQTKENPSWSENYKCLEHRGYVSYDDLPKMFSGADLLILPYDFSPQSIQFIGFSMPTKATEYMISGTPIIIFSPEQTALVTYAKRHQWAKIVTDNSVSALSAAIASLVQNKKERHTLAQNAIKVAEDHSIVKVTNKFRGILTSLANERSK